MAEQRRRRRHKEIYLALVITGVLFGVAFFLSQATFLKVGHELEGKQAPEIVIGETSIQKKKGMVVLVYFWAIWCKECMKEMPLLRNLESHFERDGFVLLALNMGEKGGNLKGQLKGESYPRNLIFNFSKENLPAYGIKGLPMSVLINKNGMIQKVFEGQTNWMDVKLIKQIEQLLK